MGGGPVIPLTLAQVAQVTGGQLHGEPSAVVSGEVVIDSRRAGPGGLFAAVAGERADGHDFARAAVAAGAVAVLATRPVPVPSVLVADVPAALAALARFVADSQPDTAIAGITGSSGKTTTKDLAAQLVERLGPTIAPAGSPCSRPPVSSAIWARVSGITGRPPTGPGRPGLWRPAPAPPR